MSNQMTLSILALYLYKESIFDRMVFPEGFDDKQKELTINNILAECAEFEIIYPDWNFMHDMIYTWSNINLPVWERIYKTSLLEYNPIENYNRTEIESVKNGGSTEHSGIDTNQTGGQDTRTNTGQNIESHSGTDDTQVSESAYDSDIPHLKGIERYTHGEQVTTGGTGSETIQHGTTNMFTHGEKIKHREKADKESHISGNIGVTTSQQMILQELNLAPQLNIIRIITNSFKDNFCIQVF